MKKKTPLFTIITCTYNRTKFLDECLDSVKKQTFRDFEHLFIDGYSTDDTLQVLRKYQRQQKDINVRIVQRKAKGVSNAFNEGIKNAKGKYLLFINSDDFLFNEKSLENAAKILLKNKQILWLQGLSGFVSKRSRLGAIFLSNNLTLKPLYLLNVSYNCPVSHQASIMHRDIFKKHGNFDENLVTHMDTDIMQRLAGKVPIYFANIKLGVWRVHKDSLSVALPFKQKFPDIWKYLYKKSGNIPVISSFTRYFKYRKMLISI